MLIKIAAEGTFSVNPSLGTIGLSLTRQALGTIVVPEINPVQSVNGTVSDGKLKISVNGVESGDIPLPKPEIDDSVYMICGGTICHVSLNPPMSTPVTTNYAYLNETVEPRLIVNNIISYSSAGIAGSRYTGKTYSFTRHNNYQFIANKEYHISDDYNNIINPLLDNVKIKIHNICLSGDNNLNEATPIYPIDAIITMAGGSMDTVSINVSGYNDGYLIILPTNESYIEIMG